MGFQPLHHLKTQQAINSAAMVKANQVSYLLLKLPQDLVSCMKILVFISLK